MEDISTVLVTLREAIEPTNDMELINAFYQLEDMYDRKLWYQLTELLSTSIYNNDNSKSIRLKLFENFILNFYNKINQLKLVEFQLLSLEDVELSEALNHLINLKALIDGKLKKNDDGKSIDSDGVLIFVDSEIAKAKLKLGLYDEAIAIVDEVTEKIDNFHHKLDNKIYSSYYSTKMEVMKFKKNYNSYYYNSLLYLACIQDLATLPNKSLIIQDICVNAVLGDKIYNFGEILMNPIFEYLKQDYLKALLVSLNEGDLKGFNSVLNAHSQDLHSLGITNLDSLREKFCIMSFIELISIHTNSSKSVKFEVVLKNIELINTPEEVESLIMKCLSLGLVKGSINQVQSRFDISWIQPRILTKSQISKMSENLVQWSDKVNGLNKYMSEAGKELWIAN
ncbi:unnamed protein product [Ambrosiozyma monospora]|uniref:Unnamed protein product n=1 Tax=Ambrosiozyma monospora TaxID=43982 RepID=A0ACB5T199_AMBMO|nr:unnamed protein product [Ambrosiozyma monospora]